VFFLSIIAILKNEEHIIDEWISHYLNEGVDHFFLIDNGSTDNSVEALSKYVEKGVVTLVEDDKKWAQEELYNQYFLPKKNKSRWFLICDLDEFVYARGRYKTIRHFLKWRLPWIGIVRIPWKMFGSSGHIAQPKSVIRSFTKRSQYGEKLNPGMTSEKMSLSKAIVRGRLVKRFSLHHSITKPTITIDARNKIIKKKEDKLHQFIDEDSLSKSHLHLNHYAIQSWEWFSEVKSKRGAADHENHESVRNKAYFDEYDNDSNDLVDKELAKKKYLV